ncbi:hypothetical protein Q4508_11775 [Amphritea sp. 2_MG-2023]|uniref:hypothetical protein n=1 Tax=Amphritea TaxID=515417 RepID=UPI001C07005E|nr:MULTISPECIES: hypothetical protein [Amphritea]MBU2967272.1 hypothetical protein [Amphritea atlantica]MDO6419230.1 hypothetical protein [Amphritea sp. 2_MG-2023]
MSWLIPQHKRHLPGKRWLSIVLRSLHLVGIAGLAGAYLFDQPEAAWWPFMILGIGSGILMAAKELYVDSIWLYQLRGQLVVLKVLLLLSGLYWFNQADAWIYIVVILISGLISHAPGKVRYYSVIYGKTLTRDIWQGDTHAKVRDSGDN